MSPTNIVMIDRSPSALFFEDSTRIFQGSDYMKLITAGCASLLPGNARAMRNDCPVERCYFCMPNPLFPTSLPSRDLQILILPHIADNGLLIQLRQFSAHDKLLDETYCFNAQQRSLASYRQ